MTRALAPVIALLALMLTPSVAQADFGFAPGFPTVRALDTTGEPYAEAGGHPDLLELAVAFNTKGDDEVEENLKNITFDFPPGFSGDPSALPTCPRRVFDGGLITGEKCDPESQVGTAVLKAKVPSGEILESAEPLFNIEPAPGELAAFGFSVLGKAPLSLRIRPGDFGVTIENADSPQTLPFLSIKVDLWGIPADHQEGTGIPRRPLLTMPTRCDRGPLAVAVHIRSWQQPERVVTAHPDTGTPLTGCDTLPFAPALSFDLANPTLDSPSGATVDIDVPQDETPDGRSASAMENVEVALPAGISVSPGVANGLSTCSDQDLHLGSEVPAACPPSARVGTVELVAPQMRSPLLGSLYLGQEHPGERFRLFVVAEGMGVVAKFVGVLHVDPASGRITTTLDHLPEISLSHIALRFDDGPRALLATPLTCGALTASAQFERYGDPLTVGSSDAAVVDHGIGGQACPPIPPFQPQFVAGATVARAGRASGLSLTLHRQSGEGLPDRFSTTMPPGLSAAVGALGVCAADAARTGSCPPGSRVGSAIGEVGSGPQPAVLRGDAFLTDGYRHAPFGLALVFHAVIGPFDLGTIVNRAALRIDSETGQVTVETDSLPGAVEGIPIRFQTLGIDLDRPGFIYNPTSCDPASIDTTMRSTSGAVALASSPFTIRGCDELRFAPRLSMRFAGRSEMHRGGRPGLRIGIRVPPGDANLSGVDIALPKTLGLDPAGLQRICARLVALEGDCPKATLAGSASARSPLSNKSFSGPVHLVQPQGDGPPELWASLSGLGTRLDVHAKMFVRAGRAHAELVDLPDMPLFELALRLSGGDDGVLALDRDPCSAGDRRQRARVALEGQNRAYLIESKQIGRPGCGRPSRAGAGGSRPGAAGA
jgi:hypothetical protein